MEKNGLKDFADKMNEIMPVVMREISKLQANELYKGKITLPQFFILEYLGRKSEAKMTDLASFMKVSTAAMTGFVDRLVRDKYVVRSSNLKDRRIVTIQLTKQGSQLVKKINEQRRQMFIKMFGRINEADRQDYLRILMQIRDNLLQEREE